MHNWDYYTNVDEDRFVQDLDLSEASKERLEEILQKATEKAYEQGHDDGEAEASED